MSRWAELRAQKMLFFFFFTVLIKSMKKEVCDALSPSAPMHDTERGNGFYTAVDIRLK